MTDRLFNILIVDDSTTNILILHHALEKNYNIRFATSGEEALLSIRKNPPDLILLDIMMPGMSGYEVCKTLRADPSTQQIPIIFVTADPEAEMHALEEGGDDYIVKPVNLPVLRIRIRNILERQRLRQELEQQRNQFLEERDFVNALLNTTNSIIIVLDECGAIIRFNQAAESFTGYSFNEVQNQPLFWERFLLPEQVNAVHEIFNSFLENRLISRSRNYFLGRNGNKRLFEWSNSSFVNQKTQQRYLMSIGNDITEQRNIEYALQETLHEYTILINMLPLGVYKLRTRQDKSYSFEFVTQKFCEMLGITSREAYTDIQSILQKIHEEDRDDFIQLHNLTDTFLNRVGWEGRIYKASNELCWLHLEASPTIMENGDILWTGIQYDITERKNYEKKLDQIAHYDPLTGVPNRRLLSDRLQQLLSRTRRNHNFLAICYLDLDSFKPVNDQLGHAAGDRLLIEITQRLKNTLRTEDTIARLGGDEFVLVLTDLEKPEECQLILQRVLEIIGAPVILDHASVNVTASIGVTIYPLDNADADTLLRHSDYAMYQAKEMGKNRYACFEPQN